MLKHTPHSPSASKRNTDVVEVPLSQGKVALIDAADAERVLAFKWSALCPHPSRSNPKWYAYRKDYSFEPAKGIYLHRFLMEPAGADEVDHRNGDGLDCRRSNLRCATRAQNAQNRPKPAGPPRASQYKGVWKCHGRWRGVLEADGVRHASRSYASELEAARAYDVLARHWHGEFAHLNFPDEPDQWPIHLVASSSQNRAGRKGEQHPRALLTEAEVRCIRKRVRAGVSQASIAREMGLRPSTINGIVKRTSWVHVEDEVAA